MVLFAPVVALLYDLEALAELVLDRAVPQQRHQRAHSLLSLLSRCVLVHDRRCIQHFVVEYVLLRLLPPFLILVPQHVVVPVVVKAVHSGTDRADRLVHVLLPAVVFLELWERD